jgi:hypothetical protein
MKTNRLIYWIRVAVLCVLWIISLLATPLLAREAYRILGDSINIEQYDRGPILVPVAPVQLVLKEPAATATPAPALARVAVPVPVPTPLAQTASLPDEKHQSESANLVKFPIGAPQVMIVIFVGSILICSLVYRRSIVHSVCQECAS